jgi:hypothetical protein
VKGQAVGVLLLWGVLAFNRPVHAEPVHVLRPSDSHAAGTSSVPYAGFVEEAAQRFSVPAAWIGAVMAIESGGDGRALSPKGAMGLMQIMPDTWSGLRARHRLGVDPYDPRDNILAGAAYLREMFDRFGSPGFLAAYNAGPRSYEEHLATGRPLPAETRHYVATLAARIREGRTGELAGPERPMLVAQSSPLIIRGGQDSSRSATVPTDMAAAGRTVVSATASVAKGEVIIVRGIVRRSP